MPVELTHLVGTVVGAVARSHAAIVNLCIEPFRSVIGREDGTHRLARRVVAVLAQHRHESGVGWRVPLGEIPLEAQPGHRATADHLLWTDHGHVVLGMAGRDAGVTAVARVQVDGHAPAVHGMRVIGIHAGMLFPRLGVGPAQRGHRHRLRDAPS